MYKEVTDIFFDLDHTLWDFEKNSALTFEMILSKKEVEVDLHDFLDVYRPINLSYWKLYREEKISKEDLRYQRLRNTFDALN
ncbi:MAG: noncanonical pyrimidine nucleotidase, YjjG family, partial [Bacteroidota bacterium]